MTEPPLAGPAKVVCHTEGCANQLAEIIMKIGDMVICGVCGVQIEDITLLSP